MSAGILEEIRAAASKRILFTPHAIRQMSLPERMITPAEVRDVVATGEPVEEYLEDPRGPSCLLLGFGDGGRPLHVACAPKMEYLAVITAYIPDPQRWSADFKRRL